jgi:hypothetical protein
MSYTVLLYGATGFSGRLIAAEAGARDMGNDAPSAFRMILAGRDGAALAQLGSRHNMDFRVFGLDDRREILRNLYDVDVILNAAGPFAFTADAFAKAALEFGCHYVDINGEVDVYLRLDDYGHLADQLGLRLVCGAAYLGGASNLLLRAALEALRRGKRLPGFELGDIRFGMARLASYTRGSALSAFRSLREEVTIVRKGVRNDQHGKAHTQLVLWHEPLGKLEHAFDFTAHPNVETPRGARLRIAGAANFVDTLAARRTLAGERLIARSIVSYLELGTLARVGYALGGVLAPLTALPGIDGLARAQLALLPDKLTPAELEHTQVIVLHIEGPHRELLVDWLWETPNAYQFTAQIAVEVARKVAQGLAGGGWLTPADILKLDAKGLDGAAGAMRGCALTRRQAS